MTMPCDLLDMFVVDLDIIETKEFLLKHGSTTENVDSEGNYIFTLDFNCSTWNMIQSVNADYKEGLMDLAIEVIVRKVHSFISQLSTLPWILIDGKIYTFDSRRCESLLDNVLSEDITIREQAVKLREFFFEYIPGKGTQKLCFIQFDEMDGENRISYTLCDIGNFEIGGDFITVRDEILVFLDTSPLKG